MEKIFEIASSITNPISLTALSFLILYLLFKGVIAKVGLQKGMRGHQLLKQMMKTVAVLAIITLILVFGLKAYQVYSNVDDLPELIELNDKLDQNQHQINTSTDSIVKKTSEIKTQIKESNNSLSQKIDSTSQNIIKQINKGDLTVQFSLEEFTNANLLIGNNGGKIILMKNLKIHWDYSECTQFKPPIIASVIIPYRYDVHITKENGDKLIDSKEFKYGAGDFDKFNVNIIYPGLGVYIVWFSFEYNIFGSNKWFLYKTEKDSIEKCMKYN